MLTGNACFPSYDSLLIRWNCQFHRKNCCSDNKIVVANAHPEYESTPIQAFTGYDKFPRSVAMPIVLGTFCPRDLEDIDSNSWISLHKADCKNTRKYEILYFCRLARQKASRRIILVTLLHIDICIELREF